MPRKAKPIRPVHVRYYFDPKAMPDHHVAMGHCKTEGGVIRGAMYHIYNKTYEMARVYVDGICVMTIKLDEHGMPAAYFGRNRIPTPR